MKKRILAMLLAWLLLAPAMAGCGSTENKKPSDDSETVGAENLPVESDETEPVETAPPMGVPAGKTFDGETITIWYTTTSVSVAETYLDLAGELTGDAIDDGMYERNLKVQDTLDVVLDYRDNVSVKSDGTGAALEKLVRAGDNTYDLFSLVQWNAAKYSYQNMFYNMKNAPYLSFDKPWWNYGYMKEMTIGEDKIYCLVGDVSLDSTRCLSCVYYNKAMYDDFYQNADGLYDVVLEGTWTLDRLMKIAEEVYEDTNANGQKDFDDRLGYAINNYNNLDAFLYGGGRRCTTRDAGDIPVISILTEQNSDAMAKVLKLYNDCPGGYGYGSQYEDDVKAREKFVAGESMFLFGFLYTAENMREMEDDYGILPTPKAIDSDLTYGTIVHDIIEVMALPVNAVKVEPTAAVLEALAYYGYTDFLPVYYETVLKSKYARDAKSAQMIELTRESLVTDLAYVYQDAFNGLGYAPRSMVQDKRESLTVCYEKKIKAAEKNMQKLVEQFVSIEE